MERKPRKFPKVMKLPTFKVIPKMPFVVGLLGVSRTNGTILVKITKENYLNKLREMLYQISDRFYTYAEDQMRLCPMKFKDFEVGRLVVARFNDFHHDIVRARILDIFPETRSVLCVDIDSWIYRTLPEGAVFFIEESFTKIPACVQPCILRGTEAWLNCDMLGVAFSKLPPIQDEVSITSLCFNDNNQPCVDIEVSLKSPPTECAIFKALSLSDALLVKIDSFTRIPDEFKPGDSLEGLNVSHVERNGEIWLQMQSELLNRLVRIGEFPPRVRVNAKIKPTKLNGFSLPLVWQRYYDYEERIFLARFRPDLNFYRVKVIDGKKYFGENIIKVQYIDFGNTAEVQLDDVTLMDGCLHFKRAPPQAFKAKLNGIARILDILEFNNIVHVNLFQKIEVVEVSQGLPVVNLYAKLDKTPSEWTGVNKLLLQTGLALLDDSSNSKNTVNVSG